MIPDRITELTDNHVIGFILWGVTIVAFAILFEHWQNKKSNKDLEDAIDEFNKDRRRVKVN